MVVYRKSRHTHAATGSAEPPPHGMPSKKMAQHWLSVRAEAKRCDTRHDGFCNARLHLRYAITRLAAIFGSPLDLILQTRQRRFLLFDLQSNENLPDSCEPTVGATFTATSDGGHCDTGTAERSTSSGFDPSTETEFGTSRAFP